MKMHILSGGRLQMRKNVFIPSLPKDIMMELPVNCYLLRHAQGNVLFDTGCHPSTLTDAESRWGGMAKLMRPVGQPGDNVIDELAKLGLTPLDIDLVVNSHFHSDHCGCNAFFKKASVICHASEYEAASQEGAEKMGYLPVDWKNDVPVETFSGHKDLFNDGRIILVSVPGHTPGMTGALVSLPKSGVFFLASDSVPIRENLEQDVLPKNIWDQQLTATSMEEIRRIGKSGAQILYGHDDDQAKSLKTGIQHYD